jgi:hypothetical protein
MEFIWEIPPARSSTIWAGIANARCCLVGGAQLEREIAEVFESLRVQCHLQFTAYIEAVA